MRKYDHLLWVDLETTGVDERLDSIIEVGAILTDTNLNEIDQKSILVEPTDEAILRLVRNGAVTEMHLANGLLDDLNSEAVFPPHLADSMLVGMLEKHSVRKHRVILAGSGVSHFDRRFIKAQLPYTDAYLAYPSIDIGVVRRTWQMLVPGYSVSPAQGSKTHRALDDIKYHLEEARAFKEAWNRLVSNDQVEG